jgi:hypothetical protein
VDELILRTVVIQFDGRVVEVFGAPVGEVVRHHVALLAEPRIDSPNRRGRARVTIGWADFDADGDELVLLAPLLEKIRLAVAAARGQTAADFARW